MGCPDWPTCFGLWIPPTNASQLPPDFVKYLKKQDIDHSFNAFHTWVEYINRLLGTLLGIIILIHTVWSFFKFYFRKRIVCWLSLLMFFGVGFEGWLGKTVVDSNLEVIKITAHLFTALFLAVIPLLISNSVTHYAQTQDKTLKNSATFCIGLLLVQIFIGTDVREHVDVISASLQYEQRETWIGKLSAVLSIHMIFSFIVSTGILFTVWRSLRYGRLQRFAITIFLIVLLIMAAGFTLAYLNLPAFIQPVHAMLAVLLFLVLFNFRTRLK